jgi:hypothetical protein
MDSVLRNDSENRPDEASCSKHALASNC